MIGLLALDDGDAAYLLLALELLRRWARSEYRTVPPSLDAIERTLRSAAPSGTLRDHQGPSPLDATSAGADGAAMDTPTRTLLLDLDVVAELLAVSRATVERLIAADDLPSVLIAGNRRRVHRDDLEDYVNRHRTRRTDAA